MDNRLLILSVTVACAIQWFMRVHGLSSGDGNIGCDDDFDRSILIILEGPREVTENDIVLIQELIVQQLMAYCPDVQSMCGLSNEDSILEIEVSDVDVCVRDSTEESRRKRSTTFITALEADVVDPNNPMQSALDEDSALIIMSLATELFESMTNFTANEISSMSVNDDDDEDYDFLIAVAAVGITLSILVVLVIFGIATVIVVIGIMKKIKSRKNQIKPLVVKPADTTASTASLLKT